MPRKTKTTAQVADQAAVLLQKLVICRVLPRYMAIFPITATLKIGMLIAIFITRLR